MTIIFELVFSQPDMNNRFFFADDKQDNLMITIVRTIFFCMPSFTLSICYGTLIKIAAYHMDQAVFAWLPGRVYSWADFTEPIKGKLADGTMFTTPSPAKAVTILALDIVLFAVLTWYFDHIVSNNRGVSE